MTEFLLLSFADLKHHKFWYWFGFPAIPTKPAIQALPPKNITKVFNSQQIESLRKSYEKYRGLSGKDKLPLEKRGFFLIVQKDELEVHELGDYEKLEKAGHKVMLGFADPSALESYPGWPLRNFLLAAGLTWKKSEFDVVCYREIPAKEDITHSIVLHVKLPEKLEHEQISCVGWEKNKRGKDAPSKVDVGFMMDPIK